MHKPIYGRFRSFGYAFGLVLGLGLPLGSGCDPGPSSGYPRDVPTAQMSGSVAGTGGKLFIGWTITGAVPSKSTPCSGVDHLTLSLNYGSGTIGIAPIPCTLGRMRYDGLPMGSAFLSLDAADPSGCTIYHGESRITLGATVPESPTPTVDLQVARGCR